MSNEFHLISHVLCPYVQRSVIVLTEKQIPFRRTDIDLANKPDWFLKLSPMGRVPVLQVDNETALFESAVITEYLNEITPNSLHPLDPLQKAHHRAWIEFGSGILNNIAAYYNAPNRPSFIEKTGELRRKFEQLETQLGEGPYFAGQKFHLIDAVYGPIFRYFEVIETVFDQSLFEALPRVQRWRKALAKRPSVQSAVSEDYPELLIEFILNRGSHLSELLMERMAPKIAIEEPMHLTNY